MAKQDTKNILEVAAKMLGRVPRTSFIVKTVCSDGSPQVLQAEPVFEEDGILKPFPTFLWLVCPVLKKKVAHLEESGKIKYFSQKLKENDSFRKQFQEGQEFIVNLRLDLAKAAFSIELPDYVMRVLSTTTIAGSTDILGVKCLHAHLAQELAFGNNPIGAEVIEIMGLCEDDHSKTNCEKEGTKND